MSRATIFIAAGLALAALLPAAPAHALRARVFVSKAGADVGTCSFSAPCQSLDYALNGVEPSGEITILDSAGYSPITITKGVTITVPPGVEAGIAAPAGGTAITINTADSSSVVSLHGLTLDGAGSGQNGIVFNNTGNLEIIDVVVRNFTNDGIELIPVDSGGNNASTNFLISNVVISHNGHAGIEYIPQVQCVGVNAVIDRTVTTDNAYGMSFTTADCVLGARENVLFLAISNSIASNNSHTGMLFNADAPQTGPSMIATIDTSNINNNNQSGISATGQVTMLLKHSEINSNGTGVDNETASPGKFNTYGDNAINSNNPGGDIKNSLFLIPTK